MRNIRHNIENWLRGISNLYDPIGDVDLQLHFPVVQFFLVGLVHGFVCFNYFFDSVDSIYILNPTTREYIVLPEPQRVRKWPNIVRYGFGFDPVKLEYKVVRIYQGEIRDDDTNGLKLCSGCWKIAYTAESFQNHTSCMNINNNHK